MLLARHAGRFRQRAVSASGKTCALRCTVPPSRLFVRPGRVSPSSSLVGHQVAERLREMVASSPYELDSGETLNISVSIGLCSYTSNSQLSLEKFLEKCDEQLYRAKKSGRNRVCMPEQDRLPQSTVSAEEKDALFKP